jgi:long-chain acyl-CoA synthetase
VPYRFTGSNASKPALLAGATANARTAVQQSAEDSGAGASGIRRATRGHFALSDPDAWTPEDAERDGPRPTAAGSKAGGRCATVAGPGGARRAAPERREPAMGALRAEELPDTLAALLPGGRHPAVVEFRRGEARHTSFDALREAAAVHAEQLGAEEDPGAPVALLAAPSTAAIAAALGVLRAGRVILPLDTQLPADELRDVLGDAGARTVLADERRARRLEGLEGRPDLAVHALGTELPRGSGGAVVGPAATPDPGDRAVLFYTSGTTGPPKGVPLTHGNVLHQLRTVARIGLVGPEDRVLQPLPLHHVYPFVIGLLAPLAFGLPVVLPERLSGTALARALRAGQVTVALGVPRLHRALLEGVRGRLDALPGGGRLFDGALALSRRAGRRGVPLGRLLFAPLRRRAAPALRLLASGGSPLDPDLGRDLEAFGWPVAVGYGLTETSPLLTVRQPGQGPLESVGRAVPEVELRVDARALEADGERPDEAEPARGARGEVLVRGPNVFTGYHGRAGEEGEAVDAEGWYRTGDVGRLDEDGFLYLEGRLSTRIALEGGENVDPEVLEDRYGEAPGVAELGILEHDGRLAALVRPEDELLRREGSEGAARAVRDALEEAGRSRPSFARLSQVELTTHRLPRTRLGKLRRTALRSAFEEAACGDRGPREARPLETAELDAADRTLLEDPRAEAVWELLRTRFPDRPVAPDAQLELDLGIDSLGWVELSLVIARETGFSPDEGAVGAVDRVRDLLEAAAAAEGDPSGGADPIEDPERALPDEEHHWAQPRGPLAQALAALVYGVGRTLLRLRVPIEVHGLDRLPERPFLLTPNHSSYLDAPALAAALGRRRAGALFWAGETNVLFGSRLRRAFSRLMQVVPVDPRRGPGRSLAAAALVLERGHPLVWFPEGNFSTGRDLRRFRPGVGLLLRGRDVPAVPVFIEGADQALPRGHRLPRRHPVHVHVGAPLSAAELRRDGDAPEAIAARLRGAVVAAARGGDGPGADEHR